MSFADKKGITVASGFKLQAGALLDARGQVETIAERDELVILNAVTAGLQVYVKANKTMYVYNGTGWDEVSKGAAYSHPTGAGNKHIPAGGASGQILRWSADGTAVWGNDNNTTYSPFKGATTDAAGGAGLVPAPAKGDNSSKFLKADGTWQTPPNTTYSNMTAATASAAGKAGLVPAPAAGAQTKYLRGDGTWQTPPNTTYSAATTSAAGLMSATDKTKLDGIATGANKTVVDTSLSTTSTNPVQNKIVKAALDELTTKFNNLIADAPEAYDTLKEISDYIATHTTEYEALLAVAGNKVDKVSGKGLSTNDFTTELKTKLDGIAAGANKYTHPTTSGNKHIPSGGSAGQILRWSSDGTAVWGADNNTTYSAFKGATASAAGGAGLVPAPATGTQAKFLRGDGTWQTPPNTTYNVATQSANGLMSKDDKKKLDTMPQIYFADELPASAPAGSICFLIS